MGGPHPAALAVSTALDEPIPFVLMCAVCAGTPFRQPATVTASVVAADGGTAYSAAPMCTDCAGYVMTLGEAMDAVVVLVPHGGAR